MVSRKLRPDQHSERKARSLREQKNLAERDAYHYASTCERGHDLRKGPWGMRICETCTTITMEDIRKRRAEARGITIDG